MAAADILNFPNFGHGKVAYMAATLVGVYSPFRARRAEELTN
jgi:hypothetical protein